MGTPPYPQQRLGGRPFDQQANQLLDAAAARAKEIAENDFDLVTMYDCLHDMGDPRGCAGHVRKILKQDGTWMIVEPIAGDKPEQNMNSVGRLYYNASTMICVPTSLDQEVGEGVSAQAGQADVAP